MSLLIDALKKYRQEATSSLAGAENIVANRVSQGLKAKKIVCISLITVIVIALTATVSFLAFKHIEKKRITHAVQGKIAQVQKVKALLEEKKAAGAETSEAPGALREKLKQRMQQKNENEAPAENSATTTSDTNNTTPVTPSAPPATVDASSDVAPTPAPQPPAASNETPRARMIVQRAHRAGDNAQNNSAPDNSAPSSTAASSDESDDASNSSDSSDSSSGNSDVKVDIQVVPDQMGANNPTYQKALGFMQVNQYNKALALLVDNDDLLLKTQGLSALLLARIYLTTGQYELADQVLDHALMLHVGSDMDLLGLRAQALFMQMKYQETIDLLSSQSPDLSTSPGYYALLADTYMHLDQASNAVSVFQQIVARFPNSPDYWLGLAVAYQKTGDASSALVAYRRAAQLSPDDPQVTLFINQQIQVLQAT